MDKQPILIVNTENGEWELNYLLNPLEREYKSEFISFPIVELTEEEDIRLYIEKLKDLQFFIKKSIEDYKMLLMRTAKENKKEAE